MIFDDLDNNSRKLAATFAANNPDCEQAMRDAFGQFTSGMQASSVNSTDRTQISAMAFACRLLQVSYGAFEAIKTGNITGARILYRSALEALFALAGFANPKNFESGRDFYMRMLFKTKHSQLQALKRFLNSSTSLSPELSMKGEAKTKALEQELSNIKQHQLTQVRDVADAAGMLDLYAREYAYHSSPTHADMEDVVNAHTSIRDGKISINGLSVGHGEAKEACVHLVLLLMEGTIALERLFSISVSAEQEAVRQRLSIFYGNFLTASA